MRADKKIVHLTSVHHPYDPRIFHKQCQSLKEAGYDVTLLAKASEENKITPVKHIELTNYQSKFKRMIKGNLEVYKKAKQLNADLYHFHDPELMLAARLLKRRNNVVVYDIHEDFVTSLIKKDYLKKPVKKLIKYTFRTIEKMLTSKFKKVIAEKYYQEIYPDAHMVLNYPVVNEAFLNHTKTEEAPECRVLYTGNVDEQRGAFIHAELPRIHENVHVHLVGKCPKQFAEAIDEIASSQKDRIHINGIDQFIKKEEIDQTYLSRNWLAGLALFPPTDHYLKKELTKFFEYMNAGIPILCSNFPKWKEFVERYQCGLVVDPYDEKEIHDAIEYLYNHPEQAKAMGENGKQAVLEELNWQTQADHLVKLYDSWLQLN
ncbi:glycosyltransferase [Halalkalibacillus halophilus]|uniref:glycosyltransferase n=1 Tax=Halalkalibacillus halophilus TaxID=392827 RepID=UPI0004230A69|nr:glycosyltransferase [Halalkalibacillus halophilus]